MNDESIPAGLLDARDASAPLRARLLKVLADADAWMTEAGIANQVGDSQDVVAPELAKLVDEQLVRRLPQGARGLFKIAKSDTPAPADPIEPENRGGGRNSQSGKSGFNRSPLFSGSKVAPMPIRQNVTAPKKDSTAREPRTTPALATSAAPTETPMKSQEENQLAIVKLLKNGPMKKKAILAKVGKGDYAFRLLAKSGKILQEDPSNRQSAWRLVDGPDTTKVAKEPPAPASAPAKPRKPMPAAPARQPAAAQPAAGDCKFALWDDGRLAIEQPGAAVCLPRSEVVRLFKFLAKLDAVGAEA